MACKRDYILRRQNGVQLWDNSLRVLPFITIDSIADGSSWDQKIINVTYPAADTSRGETVRCWTYSVNGNAESPPICSGNSATVSGFSEGTHQVTVRLVAGNNELGRASTSVEVIEPPDYGWTLSDCLSDLMDSDGRLHVLQFTASSVHWGGNPSYVMSSRDNEESGLLNLSMDWSDAGPCATPTTFQNLNGHSTHYYLPLEYYSNNSHGGSTSLCDVGYPNTNTRTGCATPSTSPPIVANPIAGWDYGIPSWNDLPYHWNYELFIPPGWEVAVYRYPNYSTLRYHSTSGCTWFYSHPSSSSDSGYIKWPFGTSSAATRNTQLLALAAEDPWWYSVVNGISYYGVSHHASNGQGQFGYWTRNGGLYSGSSGSYQGVGSGYSILLKKMDINFNPPA